MLKAGQIVKSIAGHDKDKFYMLVEVMAGSVTIADGKERKLSKPKRKNTLHIRPTNAELDFREMTTDRKLRKALADYRGENGEEGGC